MLRQLFCGLDLVDVVKDLASRYHVTPRAIYRDHAIRKEWMPSLLGLEDPDVFLMDLLASHQELRIQALEAFVDADNSSSRVGALRLVRDLNLDLYQLVTGRTILKRVEALEMVV